MLFSGVLVIESLGSMTCIVMTFQIKSSACKYKLCDIACNLDAVVATRLLNNSSFSSFSKLYLCKQISIFLQQSESPSLTGVAEWSILVQRNKRGVQKYFVIVFRYDAVVRRLDPWFVFVHCRKQREGERETIVTMHEIFQKMSTLRRKCLQQRVVLSPTLIINWQFFFKWHVLCVFTDF